MNKYQRAKSKAIKRYIRIARAQGVDISCRQAKRIDRKVKHFAVNVASLPKNLIKWGKRLRYQARVLRPSVKQCDSSVCTRTDYIDEWPNADGYSPSLLVIDESTPIEETPALWPKENPHLEFETRRLGKFHFEEETK